jgi:competence ComEA-like helix-hairpin-helix protein
MNYNYLNPRHFRSGLAGREILCMKPRSIFFALTLMLVFAASMLAGSPSVYAQESAAMPQLAAVNINTADAPTLAATLKGVGEARASEIVRYREAYGPFASVEELTEVKGIGQSTLDMNRTLITLE